MEALEAVDLKDKEEKKPRIFQAVRNKEFVSRALVGNPSVIFADEPTGNLDSTTGELVENMLFELNRKKGITLVIVTHDPDLAAKCSRIIEIKDGEIIKDELNELLPLEFVPSAEVEHYVSPETQVLETDENIEN